MRHKVRDPLPVALRANVHRVGGGQRWPAPLPRAGVRALVQPAGHVRAQHLRQHAEGQRRGGCVGGRVQAWCHRHGAVPDRARRRHQAADLPRKGGDDQDAGAHPRPRRVRRQEVLARPRSHGGHGDSPAADHRRQDPRHHFVRDQGIQGLGERDRLGAAPVLPRRLLHFVDAGGHGHGSGGARRLPGLRQDRRELVPGSWRLRRVLPGLRGGGPGTGMVPCPRRHQPWGCHRAGP
mmetsp:Transcript_35102/g.109580  ORF Transcript_35102/g.109580 Transcript_35102/m.109580 type:complete len:236 (-) Transcript_35102:205-912(-)